MSQSSVRIIQKFASTTLSNRKLSKGVATADVLTPLEHLQQRFDDAFDHVDELRARLDARRASGSDWETLLAELKQAEAQKRAALAALRKVRWMKAMPRQE
jgi:multidrug resistance efflux pump